MKKEAGQVGLFRRLKTHNLLKNQDAKNDKNAEAGECGHITDT